MATKIPHDVLELLDDDENIPAIPDDVADEKKDAWSAYAKNTDFVCKVYREIETGHRRGKHELCYTFNPVDYTATEVEHKCMVEYGGGQYWVKGYEKNRLRINENFVVAAQSEKKSMVEELKEIIPTLNSSDSKNDMMPMMQMMMSMQSEAAQRQSEMMQAGQNQMMTMLTAILPVLAQKPDIPAQTDPIVMLAALKDLIPQDDKMESVFQGIKLATELAGGGDNDKETNEMDVFKDMASIFGPAIVERVTNAEKKAPESPTPQLSPPSQDDVKRKQQEIFLGHANRLLEFAKKETDVFSVYDIMTAMLNDQQWLHIEQFLASDNWFQQLSLMQPEISQYDQWFVQLREIILNPDDESDLPEQENSVISESDMENHEPTDGEVIADATERTPNSIPDD